MNDSELLALHRELVAIPSPSGHESAAADYVTRQLATHRLDPFRVGDNVCALIGVRGPLLYLNSHLDTVPATPEWTRPPHTPTREGERVYGLGSNDAKAAVAAMIAAMTRLRALECRVLLTLVVGEETGGKGTEVLLPALVERGLTPDAVIVGEPTGLDVAVAQKGLLILELVEQGRACHAAHASRLGATNALRLLARDLIALDGVDLGPPHPELGPVTLEPTMADGGSAKNVVPAAARCVLDVRTNPEPDHDAIIERLRAATAGELRVISKRLLPCAVTPTHPLVGAALTARPEARLFGSRGASDWIFFAGIPGIKVGPGESERSHTPDEFVLEKEILAGAAFYQRTVQTFAARAREAMPMHDRSIA
ncbi:MAG: M20/M25/M40 family metallo-hydrolase [Myxococcota bacterium]